MKLLIIGIAVTLVLHFTWEKLQAPAFMDFAGSTWEGTLRCFLASLGDVLLAAGAYFLTAFTFRRLAWPVRSGWTLPAATWIAFGLGATIAFERWAVAQGRWAYGPEMPVVLGLGLLPLLQWLIVPALTLIVVRHLARRKHVSNEAVVAKAKDPVCGMTIEESDAVGTSDYKGQPYYFCSNDCKKEFDGNPDDSVEQAS